MATTTSPRTASREAAPPRALGTLAERLGLTGEVTAEHLLRLLDGRHPITGRRLLEYRKDRVAGVDQTASAPKSVSVVWAVGAPEERQAVEQAQDTAVSTLVDYMRRHCPLVRDHGEPQLAKDVLAVAVNHHTSRQTEEQAKRGTAPDPQLHTHLLWLMAERQDGRLCAIYRDQIWKNRIEWEAAYHCALATELARAGFPIQRMTGKGGRYFEIAGHPREAPQAVERPVGRGDRGHGGGGGASSTRNMAASRAVVELRREVVKSRRRKLLAQKTDLRHYWRGVAGELHGITPAALAATPAQRRAAHRGRGARASSPASCSDRTGSPRSTRRSAGAICASPRCATAPGSSTSPRWSSWSSISSAAASSGSPARTAGRRGGCGRWSSGSCTGTRSGSTSRSRTSR